MSSGNCLDPEQIYLCPSNNRIIDNNRVKNKKVSRDQHYHVLDKRVVFKTLAKKQSQKFPSFAEEPSERATTLV